jgi:hypothetical protein
MELDQPLKIKSRKEESLDILNFRINSSQFKVTLASVSLSNHFIQGILKGKYHCTIDLLFD